MGASQALVEGLLLSSVTTRLGERRTALLGYAAGALGYAVLALALGRWTIFPVAVLLALGGLAIPSVRSMVSGRGDVHNQGEMEGVLTAVEALTAVFAPLITAGLFYLFTSRASPVHFAGAPFILAAAAAVLAGILLRRL